MSSRTILLETIPSVMNIQRKQTPLFPYGNNDDEDDEAEMCKCIINPPSELSSSSLSSSSPPLTEYCQWYSRYARQVVNLLFLFPLSLQFSSTYCNAKKCIAWKSLCLLFLGNNLNVYLPAPDISSGVSRPTFCLWYLSFWWDFSFSHYNPI